MVSTALVTRSGKRNDLSRSLIAFDQAATGGVVELSLRGWLAEGLFLV
jgi:hypothetical protein